MLDATTSLKALGQSSHLSARRLTEGVALVLIVGLCLANVLLVKQNRDLKAAIARVTKQPEFLKPGQEVPYFAAKTVLGQQQGINYADRAKTVLLVFSPHCPACEQVLPYWREIGEACARNQYQVYGVSLDDGPETSAFLTANGLSLEAFVEIEAKTREAYRLSLTPLTIVIDNNAKVERIWPGVFSQEAKREVERYFGISVLDGVK